MLDDRARLLDLVASLALAIDMRRWDDVLDCFAPRVRVDYTSLFGGEAATLTRNDLVAGWQGLVPGFTRTQHTIGSVLVRVDGGGASALAPVIGHHFLTDPSPPDGDCWVVGGRYEWTFTRADGTWRIDAMTLAAAWQQGNAALPQLARERLSASA
ncbi:hypothetical protein TBR22_A21260 [Luteitalea sp. TBR-22]|uniref:nuclear transport factor 2 family protein n=1 Tax=Luteitalea sp. TBR-22 TaxID=2802971 RepID=UPI001AFB7ABF|nr:nuclear transport factor 2 family protein [Luteitalea sp. TBR-22]BCS32902.1 hypothetical protein TBR22_A21260 [Luteitalea sp. TBR-22]